MMFPKVLLSNVRSVRSHFAKLICTSSKHARGAYDAEGKTYVDILDAQRHPDIGLGIASYSQIGFRLSNGIYCVGPVVLFSRSVLSWDVGGPYDINPESLSLFTRLEPKLDILVLGIGDSLDWRRLVEKNIYMDVIKKSGINIEILTTEHACATYNFLCLEHRLVAGAFIPPQSIQVTDQDVIDTKKRFDMLYETHDNLELPAYYDIDETKKLHDEREKIAAEMNKGFLKERKKRGLSDGCEANKEYYEKHPPPESHYEKVARLEKEAELKKLEDNSKKAPRLKSEIEVKKLEDNSKKGKNKGGRGKKDDS